MRSRKRNNAAEIPLPETSEEGFHRYFELAPHQRDSFLKTLCETYPEIGEEVKSLVHANDDAEQGFLNEPPVPGIPPPLPYPSLFPDLARTPRTVDKYTLLSSLGKGGAAEVFLAKVSGPAGFEKHFALKCILPHFKDDEAFRSQFEHEARLSSQLSHANIAQTYDLLSIDDHLWLVMEYIEGINLRHLLKSAHQQQWRLPLSAGVYIVHEVCKGLSCAHDKNIIHRDVSPKNVMLGRDGTVKIIDFGIAKAVGLAQLTRIGELKGTVSYMSPEQAMGQPLDPRSDLFSAATLLWEWASGRPLFNEEDTMATLRKVRKCQISAFELSRLKIPAGLTYVLERGLQRDPNRRFQSAEEFRLALEALLKGSFPTASQKEIASLVARGGMSIAPGARLTSWRAELTKHFAHVRRHPSRVAWVILLACLTTLGLYWRHSSTTTAAKKRGVASASSNAKVLRCSLRVSTQPPAAKIFVNGTYLGTTPAQVKVLCGEPLELVLERSGYQRVKKTLQVKREGGKVALSLPPLPRQPASKKKKR